MFYSQFILAKKGPLGTIWIAAHLERKLRKNQVADTDIGVSVDSILFPDVPIALRLSSHLLLGVVRIYSRKVNYLFDDCSEALLKVKQAFRSAEVDLPPEESKAPYHSITLPETFDLDDFELPDTSIIHGNYADHHVSAREQITLQDPMEGVVFSTLQFGPDERFGDGDTSQIGLDLDEELLLDKGTTSGHAEDFLDSSPIVELSVETSSLSKGAKRDEEINESPVTPPASFCNIQAPSTPGLVEESYWPGAQDAQVSDDHMDEDQNSSKVVATEFYGAASSKPKSYPVDNDNVLLSFNENGLLHDHQEVEKASSQEFLPLADELIEFAPPERAQLPLANESSLPNGMEELGKLQIRGPDVDKPTAASHFQSKEVHGSENLLVGTNTFGDNQSLTNEAADAALELPVCDSKSHVNEFCSLDSDCIPENDKAYAEPGILNAVEVDRNAQDNTSQPGYIESLDCLKPEHLGAHERISPDSASVIQPCNTHHDSADKRLLSALEPVPQACSSDLNEANASSDQMRHPVCLSSIRTGYSNLDGQADSLISTESLLEKENGVAFSDLPFGEKLLSIPSGGKLNAFLVDSTPRKEILAEGDGGSTVNMLSGKKRSLTESTLTFQSITSVESLAATQSKKSVEFIPDDDDLLSSILVGRRSAVLGVKPTPPIQDVDFTKRRRVTPRTTAKRKMLMDDTMVLHGDTIRQQLTNTEDIRRLRKKAPCTCREIWVLQKQLLEDKIFIDPLFSGMSAELISLHSQPFDLSGIKMAIDEASTSHFPTTNERESCSRPVHEETGALKNNLESVDRDATDGQRAECHEENLNQQSVKDSSGHWNSQQDISGMNSVIENEGRSNAADDGADHSVIVGENLSSINSISLDNGISNGYAIIWPALFTKTDDADVSVRNDVESSVQIEQMLHSTDREVDSQPANIVSAVDDSAIGLNDGKGIDSNLADQSNKGELDQSTEEVQCMEHVEGFDSLGTRVGIDVDESLHLDDVSAFAAMFPQIRVLEASNDSLIEKATDQCETACRDDILGFNHHGNRPLVTESGLDSDMVDGDLEQGNTILAEKVNAELLDVDAQQDFETQKFEHDTDFLNYDDDDDEIADDAMPDAEETGMQENIGWSARTRAVAKYLQVLFHKEAQRERRVVHLDNLLAGKSRKEASRMFFETLVLKTRDYIHVEQEEPFCSVCIKPRHQLMKSEV
ncbi:hypothetical protein Dimus_011854 [Dionaea muscipula]